MIIRELQGGVSMLSHCRRERLHMSITGHRYKMKPEADYAIATYGSELAGDILNCAVCGKSWEEHKETHMTREQVFEMIAQEREYQDKNWPRDDNPLVKQYTYAAPHIYMLKEYAAKTRALWVKSVDETDVLRNLGKMATIAYRAIMEIKGTTGTWYTTVGATDLINTERRYQDMKHPRTKDNAGQYSFSAPHALLVERYIGLAEEAWSVGNRDMVLHRIVQIAAILVRALEEIEGPNLLFIGLR